MFGDIPCRSSLSILAPSLSWSLIEGDIDWQLSNNWVRAKTDSRITTAQTLLKSFQTLLGTIWQQPIATWQCPISSSPLPTLCQLPLLSNRLCLPPHFRSREDLASLQHASTSVHNPNDAKKSGEIHKFMTRSVEMCWLVIESYSDLFSSLPLFTFWKSALNWLLPSLRTLQAHLGVLWWHHGH